ncbi:SpaA isopeptide-forming pilin-related protein [Paenibacillus sp. GCM10027626]|uniref:SpaA isopeptide-forming pilin-related protein n=1 Tax=Paenibacillus sp. GCM10027626 TaxID=3273411 RepID=UPI003642C85F
MKALRRSLSFYLVIALVLNMLFSGSLISASGQAAAPDAQESVVDSTYGRQESLSSTVTDNVYQIKENIITSIKMTDKDGNDITQDEFRPDVGSRVRIDFEFAVPDEKDYKAGSFFKFKLPDGFFKTDRKLEGDLDNGAGTFLVTSDGEVTLTFSEKIEDGDFKGEFFVWREFSESLVDGSTKQTIDFKDIGKVDVHFKGKNTSDITKTGWTDKPMNPNEITWRVDFNLGEQEITNAVFQDKLPAGLELDKDSIKVYPLTVKVNGSVEPGDARTNLTPEISPADDGGTNVTINFGDVDRQAYRVEYKTAIKDGAIKEFKNDAKVTGDNPSKEMKDSVTVKVKYSEPLQKEFVGIGERNADGTELKWKIKYNFNERKIEKENAWIKDTFSSKPAVAQEVDVNSFAVYKVKIDINGDAAEPRELLEQGEDYTVEKEQNGFTLKFNNDVEAAYEISYSTIVKDRIIGWVEVPNKVESGSGHHGGDNGGVWQAVFNKWDLGVNFADKTIKWDLGLNEDRREMKNVKITDDFEHFNNGQNLQFVEGSLKVWNADKKKWLSEAEYTVKPFLDLSGFTLEFINPVTDCYYISYEVKFDPTKPIPVYDGKKGYKNFASLKWTEPNGDEKELDAEDFVPVDTYTKNNGRKTGKYNAETKEITWTIDVNYNLNKIKDAVVSDYYTAGQDFVDDSLEVYELELTGGENGVKRGKKVEYSPNAFEKKTHADGRQGFELKLGDIEKAYRITYKTSLNGKAVDKTYSNDATLFSGSDGKKYFTGKADVTPPHVGEYINKKGWQGQGADSDYAYWKMEINFSKSLIEAGAVLKDTLSDNQILLPDSIELYETKVDEKGNVTQLEKPVDLQDHSKYELTVNGNHFEIKFIKEIEAPYILKYKSFIKAEDGETINNDAEFAGQVIKYGDEKVKVIVEFAGAGGNGGGKGKGNIKVVKVEAGTNHPLEGAVFGLYDKSGKELAQLTTNKDGVAEFKGYRYQEYTLKELKAPEGYKISEVYKEGKAIKLELPEVVETVHNDKILVGGSVTLLKVDSADKQPLAGVKFKLQDANGNDVANYTELVTDAEGKISVTGLPAGDYQFVEVAALQDYVLNSTPLKFSIAEAQTLELKMENELVPGSVKLVKVSKSNHDLKLAGAEFTLQDANGEVVTDKDGNKLEGLTTDANGELIVENLAPGKYQFIETKAPTGYVKTDDPIKFEIERGQEHGKHVEVMVENAVKPTDPVDPTDPIGSVKLIKVSKNNHDVKLAGAEFTLQNASGEVVTGKDGNKLEGLTTDANGELIVIDLAPGQYQFVETKAPAGYVKTDDPVKFEIKADQKQDEHVVVTVENAVKPTGPVDPVDPTDPVGSVKLIKVSKNNHDVKLAGAEFMLQNASGEVVTGKDGNKLEGLTTDANGELIVKDLAPGQYQFVETKAPAGYVKSGDPIKFEIKANQQVEVIVENALEPDGPYYPWEPGTPEEPGEPNNPGKPTDPVIIDEDPEVPLGGIDTDNGGTDQGQEDGDEVETIIDETVSKGGIDPGKKPTDDVVLNEKPSSVGVLPKTGEDSSLPFTLAGFSLVLAGALIFRRARIKRKS